MPTTTRIISQATARPAAPGEPRRSLREWVRSHAEADRGPGGVLVHAPSTAFQAPGGGENQLVQTARQLEARGIEVRLFSPWIDRIEDYRLLHLFGMSREGLELAKVARRRGVPVVLSPICWLERKALYCLARSRVRGLWDVTKWTVKRAVPRIGGWRDELIRASDAILPNSGAEADQLVRFFRAPERAIRVVPNGVDCRFESADSERFRTVYGPGDFVLYAGRIEPRKNVLGLIRATRRVDRPVVVIGDAPPGPEDYLSECQKAGRGLVTWYGGVEHDDPWLASAYAAARVFALPSWFETPGLAALEAALAGASVVITPLGCTREYFDDLAHYARPDRIDEIAGAIDRAWEEGPRAGLGERIKERFLWTHVARRTAEAYDHVAR